MLTDLLRGKIRLSTLKLILLFIYILFTGLYSCKKGTADVLPAPTDNVIMFLADDFGYELPSFTGGRSYNTFNLDLMANGGMQFHDCFSHPDGSPSRLALLTGKYSFRNYEKWGYLPPQEKTIGNFMKDAGYQTCYVGKWQLDGGGEAVQRAGFDNYRIFLPFGALITGEDQRKYRYKSPKIYENGDYLPDAFTKDKYSEDLFYEYVSNFIDKNTNKPFFIIFSHSLVARPFVPTPDDPEYAAWNPELDEEMEDVKYFSSMVEYMDKIIGKVKQKIESKGLAQKTLILFTSDNTTPKNVESLFDSGYVDQDPILVRGGKNNTNKSGTHVPMLAYWPGKIRSSIIDSSLVDFTDFLPTLADVAKRPKPSSFGTLDGRSFYDDFTNTTGEDRYWIFCHWDNDLNDEKVAQRYVHDHEYKLYDSISRIINGVNYGTFYKIKTDFKENKPLQDTSLTEFEINRKERFQEILNSMQ